MAGLFNPVIGADSVMIINSTAFTDGGMIPPEHTGFGADISPELIIIDAPDTTVSLAIILDDTDVPWCKSFTHWLIWNIPKTDVIPAGLPAGATICEPFAACQGIAWGKNRYRGPKQPFFIRREHRYVFTVYALDSRLALSAKSDKKALLREMNGHILAAAKITGKYRRGHGV